MKTAKWLFSVLYSFRACENTERIVSITTLMNQCSSSNRAAKHFFIFTYNIFSLFPQTHSLSLSPLIISDFLFFFYIFFRLVFIFFMPKSFPSFLSNSLISNFYFSGIIFWVPINQTYTSIKQICKYFTFVQTSLTFFFFQLYKNIT